MLPIRRHDSLSENTLNILSGVKEALAKKPQSTNQIPISNNQVLLSEASLNKKFSYLGKGLYKEADDSNIGKIWFTKEIEDPETGTKQSWLVAYVDDNDELIKQISSKLVKEAGIVKSSSEPFAQDGYGNHLFPDDVIETNEGRRGTVLSVEDEDVILVKWDEGEDYPVRLYTGLESSLGIRKIGSKTASLKHQAATVNPKNIPLSPGIKSKNITMDETGGTQNAKVTIEFTDAGKGLDFYQNLEGVDTGKSEAEVPEEVEGQQEAPPAPAQPAQPAQNTKQAPQPQATGMGFPAQSSLKSTIAKMTHGGLKVANVIVHDYGFSFINEDNKEVSLDWSHPLKIGSIFVRPDNGESVRLGNYMEVNFQTDDEDIIEDIVDMLVSPNDVLKGGVGDDLDIEDFDEEQVDKGKDVEKEHSNDEDIIEDIVKDHLAEDGEYYDKLEDIEKKKESSLRKKAWQEPSIDVDRVKQEFNQSLINMIGSKFSREEREGDGVSLNYKDLIIYPESLENYYHLRVTSDSDFTPEVKQILKNLEYELDSENYAFKHIGIYDTEDENSDYQIVSAYNIELRDLLSSLSNTVTSSLNKIAAAEDLYSDTVSMIKDIPNVKLKSAYYNGGFSITLPNGNTLEVETFDSEGKNIKRPGFTPGYFTMTEYDGSNTISHGKFNNLSDVMSKIRQVTDSEPRLSSLNKKATILPTSNPQEQEQYIRDYAERIKSQNPTLSQKVDSIMTEYNNANKSDYNVNRQYESKLENLMLGIDTAASMKESSALSPDMSSQDNYNYITDYADRLREQYPEASDRIDLILTNFYSEPYMTASVTRKYESQLENIVIKIGGVLSSLKKRAEFDDPSEADNWFPIEPSDFIKETLATPDVADELRELTGDSVYNNLNKLLESANRGVNRGSYSVSQNVMNKWGYSFPLSSLQDLYFYLHQYSRYLGLRTLEYAVDQVRYAIETRDQQRDKTNKATTKIHFHYDPYNRDLSHLINYLQNTYVENKDYRRDMPYSRDSSSYRLTDLIIYNPDMLKDSKLMSIINKTNHSGESISSIEPINEDSEDRDTKLSSLRLGSANVASSEWISSHLPSNWKNAPEEEIIYHFLDEMDNEDGESADVSYEAMKAAFNRYKRETKASKGRFFTERELLSWNKTAADISDSVSPMGWTTQESNSAPSGAGPALPQQQSLQDQPDVLYDSNKDSGPKFQTTIDPKEKSVTVKFLESEEMNKLDNAVDQSQQLQQQSDQPQTGQGAPNLNFQNTDEFKDQDVPISY